MKKKILSLLVLLAAAVSGYSAPYEVQIGEGTSTTGYFPLYTLYNYSISECLFLASELTEAGVGAGPITSLSWYATNETGYTQQGINIWLANVSDEELTTSSHTATGMTQVYADGSVTPVIGWNEFECNGDFSWDGTSNLLILVQRNNGAWNSTVNWQATSDIGFYCMAYRYQDSGAYDVTTANEMYTVTTRPNIIIKGESAGGFSLTKGENEHGTIVFTNAAGKTITSAQEGQTVTVTITPAEGWVVNEPSGQWYAAVAAARRRVVAQGSDIDLLKDIEFTAVEGQENTWTFTMARANAEISATYKKLLTNTDITVQDITALTYTGVAQTPTVTVKDGTTTLVKDVDYTVTYSNNVNACPADAEENAPTVTITALATSENYAGTATKTFTINKKALTVTAEDKTVTYGDAAPTFTVSYDGFVNSETEEVLAGELAMACDYVQNESSVGEYTITPSGLTSVNYDITFANGTLTVGWKALEDGMIADIDALIYTSEALRPALVVTFNGMTLVEKLDYSVAYTNNVNVGTATVTITATRNSNYSGTASTTFEIEPLELTSATLAETIFTYNQEEQTAEVASVTAGILLVPAEGYDVTGNKATDVGTYTATITGKGNFTGSVTAQYSIVAAGASLFDLTVNPESFVYDGTAKIPDVTVKDGETVLTEDTDYTIAITNNVNAGIATITVTGQGNYSGIKTATFAITPAELTEVTLAQTTFIFNGSGQTAEVASVKAGELDVPAEGYDVTDNTAKTVGTYTATVTGKGNFTGTVTAQYSIVAADAQAFTLTVEPEAFVYDGQEKKPAVTVMDGETELEEGTDYTLTYTNNVNAGTAIVIATGMGNYSGTASKTFTITPAELTEATLAETNFVYTGTAQTAEVATVKAGELDVPAEGYEVSGNTATTPGTYTATITGKGNFKGEVSAQYTIAGYELTIDGDECITYYREDVKLTLSEPSADKAGIYTVTSVDENTATAEPISVAAPGTPILIRNNGSEPLTVYLVPTEDEADNVRVVPEFKGTTIDKEMPASSEETDYYIFNGKAFAWVKSAGKIRANKCWLEITNQPASVRANKRSLVFGDGTTGLKAIDNGQLTIDNWYDLNGRKLNAIPTKKGVYIMNGKKVVIK